MKKTRIYFFSGAGHSFAVARELATGLEEAELVNISLLLKRETITDTTERIGFVFPVYGGMPPKFIRQWLARFRPGAGCNGCGICVRLCPADNIRMIEGFPQWGDNCFGCMGCFHWCPENAVKDVGLDMIQSRHREVTVGEMLKYAKKTENG